MSAESPAIHDTAHHQAHARAEARHERVIRSPHFRDGRFVNVAGPFKRGGEEGGWKTMREFLTGGAKRRPSAPLPVLSPLARWAEAPRTGLRATWLGHSTLLLEIDGARVLTDPVWAQRASPVSFMGPKRFHEVPVTLAQLPPLDAILVSHNHYDHLDAEAVASLARLSEAPFVTALGVGAYLERFGVPAGRIIELDWWEQAEIPNTRLVVKASPAQHFSGRGPFDQDKALWASFTFAGPRHRVFFSGDTGLEPSFAEIAARHGPFDLVMLEVGAYHPSWKKIHLGPWQALEAHQALGGGPLLPIHWGTFDLALHPWDEPITVLSAAARESGLPLVAPALGDVRELGDRDEIARRARLLDAWWEKR